MSLMSPMAAEAYARNNGLARPSVSDVVNSINAKRNANVAQQSPSFNPSDYGTWNNAKASAPIVERPWYDNDFASTTSKFITDELFGVDDWGNAFDTDLDWTDRLRGVGMGILEPVSTLATFLPGVGTVAGAAKLAAFGAKYGRPAASALKWIAPSSKYERPLGLAGISGNYISELFPGTPIGTAGSALAFLEMGQPGLEAAGWFRR